MRLLRIAPFAFALVAGLAGPAQAQMPPGFGMPQQDPPCLKDFVALRDEAQKRAAAIKAGIDKKIPREEACKLFQAFGAAEAKMIKFAEANAMSCGIPPQAIAQMKQGQVNSTKIRTQVCAVGAGPAKPAAPSLSDALGTSNAPIPEINKGTGGTFNTLTGNALAR